MNSNYYAEILKEIEDLYIKGERSEADRLLANELHMPYIPSDVEKKLLELKDKYKKENDIRKSLDEDELYDYLLSGDDIKELIACNELDKMNLRDHHDIIQKYLLKAKNENARALLIASLIDQGIREEYKVVKDGIEYDFIPLYCDEVQVSDGYIEGFGFIDKTIANENISITKMAKSLLTKVCFDALPLSLSESEGLLYAKSIIIYIFDLLGDEKGKEIFMAKNIQDDDILIEKERLDEIFRA